MIGKENIEEKIFEYFEGDLSASEAKELEQFVQANPEYQEDFNAWQNSVVEDTQVEYKHMDDLLVEEKASPRGWFNWATGGTLLLLISVASAGIFNKMKAPANIVDNTTSSGSSTSAVENSSAIKVALKESVVKDVADGIGESENLTSGQGVNVSENAKNINLASRKVIQSNSTIAAVKNGERKNVSGVKAVKDFDKKKSEKRLYDLISLDAISNEMNIIKGEWAKITDFDFDFENPNKKKEQILFTNFKDPYLNYNLAHTLEENGSFVGNSDGVRAEFLYRTEWPRFTSESYESQIGSIDFYSSALKGGIGVLVNRDMIGHGKLGSLSASLIYSPKFIVKGISVEPSLKYTYNQKEIRWDQVDANDIKDPRNGVVYASIPFLPEGVEDSKFVYHDFGFGLLVNAKKFYAGFQYDHVNNPSYKEAFFDQSVVIPGKYSVNVGTDIMKNDKSKFSFSPSLNYTKFGVYNALWLSTQATYKGAFVVVGAATNNDLMFSVGYGNSTVRLVYGLGYAKPSEFSGLSSTKYYDSHQLSLRLNLKSN